MSFDIILKNITRNIILQDISVIYKLLNKDGEILISGFLEEDLDKISNFEIRIIKINKKNKGKWYLMHLKVVLITILFFISVSLSNAQNKIKVFSRLYVYLN